MMTDDGFTVGGRGSDITSCGPAYRERCMAFTSKFDRAIVVGKEAGIMSCSGEGQT